MVFRYKIWKAGVATLVLGTLGISSRSVARENIQTVHHKVDLKTSVTRCLPAGAAIDLDINNVRARLMTGGDMWWNIGEGVAAYEVPKGSGRSSQFAASCWIGGYDQQNQLKVAAQTYRQDGNDYWPGALDGSGQIAFDQCNAWDQFWKVTRATINSFIELSKAHQSVSGPQFDVINRWPGRGNAAAASTTGASLGLNNGVYAQRDYAPFVDLNNDGIYEPESGEYPKITGDEYIWWVFNDAGNVKLQSQTAAIGVEIQTSAFAYSTQDFLNDATFCQYRVINYGALTIDSTYIAVWDDCDLGWYLDDYIGCDTSRGLGIQYNGTNDDGASGGHPVNSYGLNPPQVGLDFFQGPVRVIKRPGMSDTMQQLKMTNFTYYNNDASVIGNPNNGIQIYNYMTGSIRDGERFSDDFQAAGTPSKGYGSGPVSNFVFTGDPGTGHDWAECTCNNPTGDRRFIFSSGPFQLFPGAKNDIIFGCVWAPNLGGCPVTSFKQIKNIDDGAQALFDNNFKTIEGPEAPRLVVRELDRRLIFYMINDYGGNNFNENYGRNDGTYKDSLQYHQLATKAIGSSTDTLYRFQGYRVFQLANSQITSAQIFDANTGEVDNTVAFEVFECDRHDSITTIVNYAKSLSVSDTTWVPQIKVAGKDSGIVHSFELTQDEFATSSDKTFINYHNYYFVAIAYSYNNFQQFDPLNPNNTQDVCYLGSAHALAGANITVVTAMPNPSNGDMGTVLNADYGSGVSITRIEGQGNGGNFVQLDSASEMRAVRNNRTDSATYLAQQGPIGVKVIDPLLVPAYDWVLQIRDSGNTTVTKNASWMLTARKNNVVVDTIYSENTISSLNEQIIEKYGISILVQQHYAPGQAPLTSPTNQQIDNNGYIGSDVTYDNPSMAWLYGVQDQADSNFANWIRSGSNTKAYAGQAPCGFNDNGYDMNGAYENMFSNYTPTKSTWAPYDLTACWNQHTGTGDLCAMEVSYSNVKANTTIGTDMGNLSDVNLVFTPEKSLWTRCAVLEMQEDTTMAQGKAPRFWLRRHLSWNFGTTADGIYPVYASPEDTDYGMSWFPGYAIDEGTGKRLNIVFGEDSYASNDNGNDMLWNPSPNEFSKFDGSVIFGGQHVTYILSTPYDSDRNFVTALKAGTATNNTITIRKAFTPFIWAGIPLTSPNMLMNSIGNGYIPTRTTLRFRVMRPYAPYSAVSNAPTDTFAGNGTFPYYTFSTNDLAPDSINANTDKNALLNRIFVVPNPYYGYSGYEGNRFDTRVKIINLPPKATINIFALDGTLIRVLSKSDPTVSYIDWDIRNSVGLPVASGMYLMDVKADGIGEVVLKWFGATRPLDVTNY